MVAPSIFPLSMDFIFSPKKSFFTWKSSSTQIFKLISFKDPVLGASYLVINQTFSGRVFATSLSMRRSWRTRSSRCCCRSRADVGSASRPREAPEPETFPKEAGPRRDPTSTWRRSSPTSPRRVLPASRRCKSWSRSWRPSTKTARPFPPCWPTTSWRFSARREMFASLLICLRVLV